MEPALPGAFFPHALSRLCKTQGFFYTGKNIVGSYSVTGQLLEAENLCKVRGKVIKEILLRENLIQCGR